MTESDTAGPEDTADRPRLRNGAPGMVGTIWPPLLMLIGGAGMAIWAQSYSAVAAQFPTLVGVALAVLAALDLWSRTGLPGAKAIQVFGGAGFERLEMPRLPPMRSEWILVAWVLVAFWAMALFGALFALPAFCLIYIRFAARRSWIQALMVAIAVLVFNYVIFEWLLNYELYRGLLFTKGGFSRW